MDKYNKSKRMAGGNAALLEEFDLYPLKPYEGSTEGSATFKEYGRHFNG